MFASLVRIESFRTAAEIRRGSLEYIIGNAILVGMLVFLLKSGAAMQIGLRAGAQQTVIVYLLWILLLGATGTVPREIQKDLQTGAISRILLTSYGFRRLITARFVLNVLHSLIIAAVFAVVLYAIGTIKGAQAGPWPLLFLCALIQAFGLTLIFVGVALMSRSERATQSILFATTFPLLIVPFEHWIGGWVLALPLAGVIGLVRSPSSANNVMMTWALVGSTAFWAIAGVLFLGRTLAAKRKAGTLLHR